MNRAIKFRVWDTTAKRMFLPLTDLHIKWNTNTGSDLFCEIEADDGKVSKWSCSDSADDYEIMQYTGLKDKNGKEIYEGDIIDLSGIYKYTVVYEEAKFVCYHVIERYGRWGDLKRLFDPDFSEYHFHVVGNIYENLELLEKAKEVTNG